MYSPSSGIAIVLVHADMLPLKNRSLLVIMLSGEEKKGDESREAFLQLQMTRERRKRGRCESKERKERKGVGGNPENDFFST